jgi:hypothetical protein
MTPDCSTRDRRLFFVIFFFEDMVSSLPQHEHFEKNKKFTYAADGRHRLFIALSGRQPSEEGIVRRIRNVTANRLD